MSERTSYEPGTPCWVELSGSPDLAASEAFYRELFGWEMPEPPGAAELGGYRRAKLNGRDVAGVSPRMQEGQPTVWATYVSVADAAATLARVGEAGGETVVAPMDVRGMGQMAVFSDPTGAVCGIWQPGSFAGAELVNEPGSCGWNELGTRDVGAARRFYEAVFGWGVEEQELAGGASYGVWQRGEAAVGGLVDIDALGLPAQVPPHWLVYFVVADTDAAVAAARANGGELRNGPIDSPHGRLAILADPHGAVFAAIEDQGGGA